MPKCFVVMPFADQFRRVFDLGIRPAAEIAGFECYRGDDPVGPRNIVSDIVESLFDADVIVADLTGANANVFYELGVAHAIANNAIMICQQTGEKVPFDLASYRVIFYEPTEASIEADLRPALVRVLQDLERWKSKRTNPIQDFRPIHYSVPLVKQAELEQTLRQAEAEITRLGSEIRGKPEIGKEVLIPSGAFPMGTRDGNEFEQIHDVFTDAFWMDAYPVTNGQYRAFILAEAAWRKEAAIARHHNVYYLFDWQDEMYPHGKRNHPVVWVNWHAAAAFCNWRSRQQELEPCYDEDNAFVCDFQGNGFRLPTEAEFEKAARGSLIGKAFPWGDDIDESNANYANAVGDTTEVGKYPANDFGLYDIAGNVKQWCHDWFERDYYDVSPGQNPRGPDEGQFKVFRGGSWGSAELELLCSTRAWLLPPNTNPDFGFRCVRRP